MQPQPSALVRAVTAVIAVLLIAGCEAKVRGDELAPRESGPQAPIVRAAALAGLDDRISQATAAAAGAGATVSLVIHDRVTEATTSNGNNAAVPVASVAKLFIADDMLLQDANGQSPLSPDDRKALETMLRSSDDGAAEDFWYRGGGNDVITRVAARYGLASLTLPYDGRWWNTMINAADLVRYYDMLLDGTGGLPPDKAGVIIDNLAHSTPQGIDGYPQRFGIPDGLYAESVAVKQGWMCCWDGDSWMHLSTGVIGPDHRYIMVVGSLQPSDDATARDTITQVVKSVFPAGRIS
ncbi:MAG: hypothetical protein JO152_07510 [Mycobacteriaceae bacterium]|nr:hypothetical protein [Mycobacteriaceae bacterium]